MTMIIDGTAGITFPDSSQQYNSYYGFKNRIINGAMVIDQRNAGASVTPSSGTVVYTLDRWLAFQNVASKFSVQQNAGSVTPPAGFTNYLGVTSLSAYSSGSSDIFVIAQRIEGFNTADLAFGTASASSVTISFWVRSSLTGTFGASIKNSAGNRSYPFSYVINSANTWEQKTVTIAGDTTGTWLTNNGIGLVLTLDLGSGSTYKGTANTWASSDLFAPTGNVSVVGTNGATFYITGVQLEKGSTATSFDYRPYGTELALCQRYYFKIGPAASGERVGVGYAASAVLSDNLFVFPVIMRTAPTALEQTGTAGDYAVQQAAGATACSAVPTFQTATNQTATTRQTVASGLTTGQGNFVRLQTTSGYFAWSAEL